jgi:hypothetical protein
MANVGFATLSIIPSAKGFGAALEKETAPSMVAAGKTGGAKSGGAFSKAFVAPLKGIGAPLAAAFGGTALLGALKGVVQEASNLQQSAGAVESVFGAAAAQVKGFGKGAASSVGLAKSQYADLAAIVGSQLTRMGQSQDQAAGSTDKLIGLGADLAATFGGPTSDAVAAIGSLLRGERDPIERYGVGIKAADVEARLAAQGLSKLTGEARAQAESQATLALLFEQTARVQGAAARESDTLAARQQQLGAHFTNLKATLGTALLPAMSAVVGGLASLVSGGGQASSVFAPLQSTFAAVGEFARGLAPAFQEVAGKIMATLLPGLRSVGETLSGTFLPAFRQVLPILQPVAAFIIRTLGTAVTGVITGALNVVKGVLTVIAGVFRAFAAIVKGDWSALWDAVKQIVSGVITAIKGAVQVWWNAGILSVFRAGIGSLKGLWGGLWTNIKSVGSSALNALKGLVSGALNGIKGTVQGAVSAYLGLWKSLFSTLGSIAANGWAVLRSAFGGALAAIRTVVSGALSAIGGAFRSAFSGIASTVSGAISGVIGTLRSLPGAVMGAVKGAGGWLKSAGADVIRGFISGITSMAGRVVSAIRNTITDKLPGFVKDALGIASPSKVFADLGKWTGMGFVEGVEGTERAAQRAMSSVVAPPPPSTLGASASYGSASTAGASRGGPLVQFGDVTLREEVDVDVLAHRMGFALSGHGFGGGNLR